MGLINLQTDLKSLQYGAEKPYVTKDINNQPSSNKFAVQGQARIDDVERLTKMFVDKPGITYLINNTALSALKYKYDLADEQKKINPAPPKNFVKAIGRAAIDSIVTVGSTLSQALVDGTGVHFEKGFGRGITPYLENVNVHSAANHGTNINIDVTKQKSKLVDIDPDGEVPIKQSRKSDSTVYSSYTSDSVGQLLVGQYNISNNFFYDGYSYLTKQASIKSLNGDITKERRVRLGDQGARKDEFKTANYYWSGSGTGLEIDGINALAPSTATVVDGSGKVDGNTDGRDLVKFRFHVITPDRKETVLYFRAFLDSFTDNYSGNWNDTKYLGRGETFYTYAGFQRKISLSFKIAAASRKEMMPIYKKMIYLASSTAPTYGGKGQFMRGTIVKLTLGDYVYELPGIMNSVTYNWNTEYPWEIAMTEPEGSGRGDKTMQELPMVMDCNIDFTPIHTFTPTAGYNKYITTGDTEAGNAPFVTEPAPDPLADTLVPPPAKEEAYANPNNFLSTPPNFGNSNSVLTRRSQLA
jgi:hypothetical protein